MIEKEVLFTKDILKQVADETGFDIKTVEYVYKYIMQYLHHMIQYTAAVCFFIPHLGKLYIKTYYVYEVLKKKKLRPELREAFQAKKESLYEQYGKIINDKEFFSIWRHNEKSKLSRKFYNDGLTIQQIEKKQNDLADATKK